MLTSLWLPAFAPFTFALCLLLGMLLLEVVFAFLGGSIMAGEVDADFDLPDAPEIGELDIDLGDIPEADVELATFEEAAPVAAAPTNWLGLGQMPFAIWLAMMLASFGATGVLLQTGVEGVIGTPLPAWLAAIPAAGVAIGLTKRFGRAFARALPQVETQSISDRSLGRRKGVVTQGTSSRGKPAEVKVIDGYGNTHYLRAEPLQDGDTIVQGTDVLVLRHRPTNGYRLVPLTD